jgi:Family of unknown function (DUF6152)
MKSRQVMFVSVVLTLLAGFVFAGGVLFGHHSNAKFDNNNLVTLEGTVAEYRWRNPHVIVIWDSEKDGKVVRWYGDLASITTSLADGLTKDSLKPGDKVRLSVYPAKAGTPESVILYIERLDGTVVLGWSTRGGGVPGGRADRRSDRPSEYTK